MVHSASVTYTLLAALMVARCALCEHHASLAGWLLVVAWFALGEHLWDLLSDFHCFCLFGSKF
jgi:hypothetical protein